jgi:hypothetical protein
MANHYVGSVQHAAVMQWAASTAFSLGSLVRQLAAPAVGSERVFRVTTAGTSGASEPAWNTNEGATTGDNTITWTEVTGQEAYQASGSWSAPHARLENAFAWGAAGDNFYVANDHTQTQATALTLTCPGTAAAPCRIICVRVALGTVPPVVADIKKTFGDRASINTTGNNTYYINPAYSKWIGFDFNHATGSSATNLTIGFTGAMDARFEDCKLTLGTTSAGGAINLGNGTTGFGKIALHNTPFRFSNAGQGIAVAGAVNVTWTGADSIVDGAGSVPTNFIKDHGSGSGTFHAQSINFTTLATKNLVAALTKAMRFIFENCLIPANTTISATQTVAGAEVIVTGGSSAGTIHDMQLHSYRGVQTMDSVIYRTGGLEIGGVPYSIKVVANAATSWQNPFETPWFPVTNSIVEGNVTITGYGVSGAGSVPSNDVCWMEVRYQGTDGTPVQTVVSTTKATEFTAPGAGVADPGSTWSGGTTKFKMTAALTSPQPQIAGPIYARYKVASTATQMNFDYPVAT